ncbi:MAG TPA: hypothetical protein VIJ25_11920 [Methylococcales bacterium]
MTELQNTNEPIIPVYIMKASIKQRFPAPTSEYEVNQFIEDWRPAAFAEIRNGI